MWTEILTEDVGVTHVNGHHVVFGLSDNVEEYQVRAAKEALQYRQVFELQKKQMNRLTKQIEKQKEMVDVLEETKFTEKLLYGSTDTSW